MLVPLLHFLLLGYRHIGGGTSSVVREGDPSMSEAVEFGTIF